jgi:hypothetical protein
MTGPGISCRADRLLKRRGLMPQETNGVRPDIRRPASSDADSAEQRMKALKRDAVAAIRAWLAPREPPDRTPV